MVEKAKDPKKGFITEEDTATLLHRYSPTTVLTLLKEVAHSPQARIDWNELVAGTSTGISNAREYQMLWRHLAYREALLDKSDNEAQPLDDDSDLEYEVEAFPAVSGEASTAAAACVKVLIASGLSSDSSHLKGATVEAPLTINIRNGQSARTHENSQPTCSIQGMNITVPVSVQKQPLPSATMPAVETAERGDGNGSAGNSMGPRKKRKKWSEAEDLELIAAVQKYGEGNWQTILKGDFKGDRTASQLSQRWAIIKKRHKDLNLRGNSSGELSEAQLAARHSLSVALKMPNITANTIGSAGTHAYGKFAGKNTPSSSMHTAAAEAEPQSQQGTNPAKPHQMRLFASTTKAPVTSKKTLPKPNMPAAAYEAEPESQQGINPEKPHQMGLFASATKAQVTSKKTLPKSNVPTVAAEAEPRSLQGINLVKPHQTGLFGSTTKAQVTSKKTLPKRNSNDAWVRAAAVAAGARIASPSDAASLLKAAQAKNAVHIMPTGGSSIQSSVTGGMSTHSEPHSNVHYMCTGLATTRCTPLPTSVTPSATHPDSLKAPLQTSQHAPITDTVSCSLDAELPSNQEVSAAEGSIIDELTSVPTEQVRDGAVISTNGQDGQVEEDKADSPDQKVVLKDLSTQSENHPVGSMSIERHETFNEVVIGVEAEERPSAKDNLISCSLVNEGGGDPSVGNSSCESQSTSEKHTDVESIVTVGYNGKQIFSKETAGIQI